MWELGGKSAAGGYNPDGFTSLVHDFWKILKWKKVIKNIDTGETHGKTQGTLPSLDDFRLMQYFYDGFVWCMKANRLFLREVLASKFPSLRFSPVGA